MLIHTEKKLIFSTPYKTGSHTLQATLIGARFIHTQHATYTALKKNYPEVYEDVMENFTKYVVVRNPWSHAVSHYMHNLLKKHNPKLFSKDAPQEYVDTFKSFKNFISSRFFIPQQAITFTDPLFVYDKVIKFENLNSELQKICKEQDIKYRLFEVNKGVDDSKVYFLNTPYPESYRDLYDPESIDIVSNLANNEIRLFDYKF